MITLYYLYQGYNRLHFSLMGYRSHKQCLFHREKQHKNGIFAFRLQLALSIENYFLFSKCRTPCLHLLSAQKDNSFQETEQFHEYALRYLEQRYRFFSILLPLIWNKYKPLLSLNCQNILHIQYSSQNLLYFQF